METVLMLNKIIKFEYEEEEVVEKTITLTPPKKNWYGKLIDKGGEKIITYSERPSFINWSYVGLSYKKTFSESELLEMPRYFKKINDKWYYKSYIKAYYSENHYEYIFFEDSLKLYDMMERIKKINNQV